MSSRTLFTVAGLCGAIGVALGAWHAHGLDEFFSKAGHTGETVSDRMDDFGTAVRYQMYHAAVLGVIGLMLAQRPSKITSAAGICILLGVLLFSGCLYAWTLGGPKWLVHIVPFGGVSLLAGWVMVAIAGWRMTSKTG
ncbi:MAG: DUF423 domain-containing protein [Pirellulales bacterium]|nr:DUF423 domain-containing protein [Pirellulales bacterium]